MAGLVHPFSAVRTAVCILVVGLICASSLHANECDDSLEQFELSRRNFLRSSLAAGAGAFLGGHPETVEAEPALKFFDMSKVEGVMGKLAEDFLAKMKSDLAAEFAKMSHTKTVTPESPQIAQTLERDENVQLVLSNPHQHIPRMQTLEVNLRAKRLDWLALEVFPRETQKSVDAYLTSPRNSSEFQEARRVLGHLLTLEGADRGLPGAEHPLWKALELARENKIPVYAIGLPSFSKTPIYELVPADGKGLIATDQPYEEAPPERFIDPTRLPTFDGVNFQAAERRLPTILVIEER